MDVKSGMATMAIAPVTFGHRSSHFWPAINGQNQTNLGIVGHLAMPTIPLRLRACVSVTILLQDSGYVMTVTEL